MLLETEQITLSLILEHGYQFLFKIVSLFSFSLILNSIYLICSLVIHLSFYIVIGIILSLFGFTVVKKVWYIVLYMSRKLLWPKYYVGRLKNFSFLLMYTFFQLTFLFTYLKWLGLYIVKNLCLKLSVIQTQYMFLRLLIKQIYYIFIKFLLSLFFTLNNISTICWHCIKYKLALKIFLEFFIMTMDSLITKIKFWIAGKLHLKNNL